MMERDRIDDAPCASDEIRCAMNEPSERAELNEPPPSERAELMLERARHERNERADDSASASSSKVEPTCRGERWPHLGELLERASGRAPSSSISTTLRSHAIELTVVARRGLNVAPIAWSALASAPAARPRTPTPAATPVVPSSGASNFEESEPRPLRPDAPRRRLSTDE